ncbi:MAG: hypothetical protein MHM6MM_000773 [Cercozoa sp. M6MM]
MLALRACRHVGAPTLRFFAITDKEWNPMGQFESKPAEKKIVVRPEDLMEEPKKRLSRSRLVTRLANRLGRPNQRVTWTSLAVSSKAVSIPQLGTVSEETKKDFEQQVAPVLDQRSKDLKEWLATDVGQEFQRLETLIRHRMHPNLKTPLSPRFRLAADTLRALKHGGEPVSVTAAQAAAKDKWERMSDDEKAKLQQEYQEQLAEMRAERARLQGTGELQAFHKERALLLSWLSTRHTKSFEQFKEMQQQHEEKHIQKKEKMKEMQVKKKELELKKKERKQKKKEIVRKKQEALRKRKAKAEKAKEKAKAEKAKEKAKVEKAKKVDEAVLEELIDTQPE